MPLGLLALAMGGFGIGLTEFVIMGLLPEVAADFGVCESVAGHLISGYALSVAIGAIALTAAVGRFDRKRVLMSLMVLFVVGNLLSAVAPTYEVLMAGRVVAALCHGAFFGIGAVVAADLVAPGKRAGAIATMFTGLTIANVLGVPFGTLLGQQFGWRSTFWAITVIGVVALAGIAALVPPVPRSDAADSAGLGGELRAFRSPQVWFSIAITVLGFGGMFGAFTYIAFTLTEVSGFASTTVPWLLILFGVGLFVGNYVGGKAADRALTASLVTLLAGLTVVLIVYALTAQSKTMTVVSLILMGAFGFATVPGFQMRIMNYAAQAPTMASGANIAAFNVGNALGAWLGGFAIAAGFGFVSPIWIGAAVTAAGLGVLLIATRVDRGAGVAGEERVPVAA
ncbi:DHA1 family inner membrane transport protein [Rhodococcus sp. OK611]|uniref:MFS transporter n=1 Tax=unclassified Rhodococcus (in: high G+C Gram-positive bacteria) TaxID=192944 RepID=UPI000BC8A205|nr:MULTISPECIES: MFS transporter [unclassified Rhodococcus (in: high G+C Gram-positive bacteria)]PTR36628.1 DHA1 family inner membrane transport protein [Rhodococcus sp. OK611]SNX93722.1 MFS transporter, DHA1 family, inner membrane transport protein [Rhodococcus sp. OK270]